LDYNEQMKWLDYQIKELQAIKSERGNLFAGSDEETNLKILTSIKSGYSYAYDRANEYSLAQNPDRMGQ